MTKSRIKLNCSDFTGQDAALVKERYILDMNSSLLHIGQDINGTDYILIM